MLIKFQGPITFGHDYVRTAIEARYHPGASQHLRLAQYFENRPLTSRVVVELPWQLACLHDWQRLSTLLADRAFLIAIISARYDEFTGWWAQIEANSPIQMREVYREIIADPIQDPPMAHALGNLLDNSGYLDDALKVRMALTQPRQIMSIETYMESSGRIAHQGTAALDVART